MTHGFHEREITVRSSNGRDDTLVDDLHFTSAGGTLYRVAAGSTTDGMSTPGALHGIPGFEPTGKHWFSAVLHDAAYRGTLERFHLTNYVRANLTRAAADNLFREALATQGVGPIRRSIIWSALRTFGWPNYRHP